MNLRERERERERCVCMSIYIYISMVVSQNKGTPIYYGPYYRDPQKGTHNFGKLLKP